jgi:hypothetical protein
LRVLMRLLAALAFAALPTGCHAGQAGSPAQHASWPAAPTALPREADALALAERRVLPGAGAVAFDPVHRRLAWADASVLRMIDLRTGVQSETDVGRPIADLAFAPDGDLWLLAGAAVLWRDGVRACASEDEAFDRVLGVDADGVTAASYSHSDGVGPVRHQVWIDDACRREHDSMAPLPAGVGDTGDDLGEPPRRPTLRAPAVLPETLGWTLEGARVDANGTSLTLPAPVVAVSPDGRWWVLEEDGQRTLWRVAETKDTDRRAQ